VSFILDAIAKSEQERQQHDVPGPQVLALPTVSAPQPRSLLPYVVAGALLLNAAVLAAWMQSGQSPTEPPSQQSFGEEALRNEEVMMPGGAISAEQAAVPEVAAEIPSPEIVAGVTDTLAPSAPPARPQTAVPPVTTQTVTTSPVEQAVAEQEIVRQEPAAMAEGEDTTAWIRIGPDTLSNRARNGQQAMPEQGTGGAQRKVSRLSELPVAVRNDLPKVAFSGHLYSSDPDSSMVFVDSGRPVTQGRQIAGDLFLHEITPTGVIVEFRGYLIDVGVLQNWTLN